MCCIQSSRLLLFRCPSVSSSNITLKNKIYTISHISRGIPLVISWPKFGVERGDMSLLKYLERSLSDFFLPKPPFSVGEHSTHPLLFSDSWPCPFIVVWGSQMLKCNLSGILWPLFLRSFTQGEEAQFSPPEPGSISELGMKVTMIPKSTMAHFLITY